ncbi:MAG: hypothetical protein AAF903_06340 [Pseudomonadota bacterium]
MSFEGEIDKDNWDEYRALEKQVSERNMRRSAAYRDWHDWARLGVLTCVAFIVIILADWLLN